MYLIRLILCMLFPLLGRAAEEPLPERERDLLFVEPGERIEGDLFAFNKVVEISGTVTGDVYVMGGQVFIDGDVLGSVLIAAGSGDISGKVGESVRAIGGQLRLSGSIGSSVTLLAANADITPAAEIGRDLVALAGNMDLSGRVGFNATVISSNVRISGEVKNDLKTYAEQLRLTSKAVIGNDLNYRSASPAWIDPGARIGGKIHYHSTLLRDILKGTWLQGVFIGSKLAVLFMNFLFTFVIGVILLKIFPGSIHEAIHALKRHPWKSFVYGIVLLILFPLTALLLLMTILGAPFALTVLALNVVTFYTVKIISIFWVSNALFPWIGLKPNKVPTFTLGLLLYFLLTAIPYFGPALALTTLLFGLGSVVVSQGKHLHLPAKSR